MPHDLGKNVVAFVHRANPGDGGVARSARFRISIEIETASKSQFCLAVQNVGVHPTSNVGTVVAFHAYLSAAASVLAVFMIFNSYSRRPSEPIPAKIDGKPNYNFGPIKFATAAAMFWGIAGFLVGLWAALELVF